MRSRYKRHENVDFRCFHDVTTSSLRFYNDPATIIPRLHISFSALATIITILPRSSRSHYDNTTIYMIATGSFHSSAAIIARSYHDNSTIVPRSYALRSYVNIMFHMHTVPFLTIVIKTFNFRKQHEHATNTYQKSWAWW